MTSITRHKFLGELAKLLSGMTEWDREAVTAKYSALFDADPNEEEVSARLGSPTMAAVKELRGYVPTPDPRQAAEAGNEAALPAASEQPEEPQEPAAGQGGQPEETQSAGASAQGAEESEDMPQPPAEPELVDPEDFPDIEALLCSLGDRETDGRSAAPEETQESVPAGPAAESSRLDDPRPPELVEVPDIDLPAETAPETAPEAADAQKLSAGRTILYVLFGVAVCLPAAAALTALALAILALGVGVGAAGIFAVTLAFHGITVFADVMLLCGAGVAVAALGIPISFFAFWFFMKCVVGFVDSVLRLGRKWCRGKPEKEDEDE